MRIRSDTVVIASTALVLIILAMLIVLPIWKIDRTYVDKNTGSLKGHRDWSFGLRTHEWYVVSPIEGRLRRMGKFTVTQDWLLKWGAGYSLIGSGYHEDGRGSFAACQLLREDVMSIWVNAASDDQVVRFHEILKRGNDKASRKAIEAVYMFVTEEHTAEAIEAPLK